MILHAFGASETPETDQTLYSVRVDNWRWKLDPRLSDVLASPSVSDVRVDCLIRIDDDSAPHVDHLVDELGGQVRHRIHIIPGLAVSIPLRAVSTLAANPHVVGIESERLYSLHCCRPVSPSESGR